MNFIIFQPAHEELDSGRFHFWLAGKSRDFTHVWIVFNDRSSLILFRILKID